MRRACAKNNTFCRRGARVPDRGNKAAPATTFKWRTGPHFAPRLSPGGVERHVLISASRRKKVPGLEVGETDESAVVFMARRFKPASFLTHGGISGLFPPMLLSNFWVCFWWVEGRWCHWVVQRSSCDQRTAIWRSDPYWLVQHWLAQVTPW